MSLAPPPGDPYVGTDQDWEEPPYVLGFDMLVPAGDDLVNTTNCPESHARPAPAWYMSHGFVYTPDVSGGPRSEQHFYYSVPHVCLGSNCERHCLVNPNGGFDMVCVSAFVRNTESERPVR